MKHRRRIPLASGRVTTAAMPVRATVDTDAGKHRDPDTLERREWYMSKRWRRIRGKHLFQQPNCVVCQVPGTQVDHLCGHNDEHAKYVIAALNLGAITSPDWRERFWHGPYVTLCHSHHSAKTQAEMRGRLFEWIKTNIKQ
ncbi:hypothetical protein [Ruegeria arenilitoris]|uniref:hypothetical protein n=1 Tax=Ruegeria arenilitoris TaxID=1173585 RepID=UPI00147F78D9|nr:hypothetical protein [Ruegeria arenilitoris]